ncbi:DUF945 family protein [Catenovulum maritimum]|uniref:DUF945 domain-containing protein n=1 Tax=Catenovulum maritimum TaxID=1513271 RepID=A0A0J8GVW9_9ALTE|nr:DUF945 family protein [Catenovulum maritimum]KMT65454.1 hypothetical protein XM47_08860 [Catenovulum maritimum]
MKKLFAIVLLLTFSVLIAPKFIGQYRHEALTTYLKQLDAMPGYSAKLVKYQPGWFTSVGIILIKADVSGVFSQNSQAEKHIIERILNQGLVLDISVQHGPVVISPDFNLALNSFQIGLNQQQKWVSEIQSKLQLDYLLISKFQTSLAGNLANQFYIPSFTLQNSDQSIVFGGVSIFTQMSNANTQYQTHGVINKSTAISPIVTFEAEPIQINAEGQISDSLLFSYGDASFIFPKLSMTGKKQFELTNFVLSTQVAKQNDNDLSIGYKISLDSFSSSESPIKLKNTEFAITIDSLNESGLIQLYQLNQNASKLPEHEHRQEIVRLLTELIQHKPKINLHKLNFALDEVNYLTSNATAYFNDKFSQAPKFNSQAALRSALIIEFNTQFTENLVQQIITQNMAHTGEKNQIPAADITALQAQQVQSISQMLAQYIEQKLLTKTEAGYQTQGLFKDNQLTLNNQPLALGR